MRSLVADDNPIIRALLKRLLSQYGDCDQAKDGRQAIQAFVRATKGEQPYDLICLDLCMPEFDGITVLEAIRNAEQESPSGRRVRILIVTAEDDPEAIRCAVHSGADGYLVKPIERQALADHVARFFSGGLAASSAAND